MNMSSPTTAERRKGCITCRHRHIKCNSVHPTCGPCNASHNDCKWDESIRYVHGHLKNRFNNSQTWLRVPERLAFVDETLALQTGYCDESQLRSSVLVATQASAQSDVSHDTITLGSHISVRRTSPSELVTTSATAIENSYAVRESPCKSGCICLQIFPSLLESRVNGSLAVDSALRSELTSPIQSAKEGRLLSHFIDVLSPWLDVCDRNRHFANIVPRRALSQPVLLHAIFAVSARHLSILGCWDDYEADQYHQKCLQILIPTLNDPAAIGDESLFAAVVILRLLEELQVPLTGVDTQDHHRGAQTLLNSRRYNDISSGFGQASFWVALRQETHLAITQQRPISFDLSQCDIDLTFASANEGTWAYRTIVHCVSVIGFCFGGDRSLDRQLYDELIDYQAQWSKKKPRAFAPLYSGHGGDPDSMLGFPYIQYLGDAHVTAAQYMTLSESLLVAHDPRLPRVGLKSKASLGKTEDVCMRHLTRFPAVLIHSDPTWKTIRQHVRTLCGVALSNTSTPPAMSTACVGITVYGIYFVSNVERSMLLKFLQRAERIHAWPTQATQSDLKKAWGWDALS